MNTFSTNNSRCYVGQPSSAISDNTARFAGCYNNNNDDDIFAGSNNISFTQTSNRDFFESDNGVIDDTMEPLAFDSSASASLSDVQAQLIALNSPPSFQDEMDPTPLSSARYTVVDRLSLEDVRHRVSSDEAECIRFCLQPMINDGGSGDASNDVMCGNKRNIDSLLYIAQPPLSAAATSRSGDSPCEEPSAEFYHVPFANHLDWSIQPLTKRSRRDENTSNGDIFSSDTPSGKPSSRPAVSDSSVASSGCSASSESSCSTSSPSHTSFPPATNTTSTSMKPSSLRFRDYQAGRWQDRFDDLVAFKAKHGNCDVPYTWQDNQPLAQWVKRMRYQFRLKNNGKRSTMTDERFRALTEIGLCWDFHDAVWNERLEELRVYKAEHGHCNVPGSYEQNKQLAIWVKRQRRQNKLYCQGDRSSTMTAERVSRLDGLGFVWDPRAKKAAEKTSRNNAEIFSF